jgi:hypothetical protein
MAVVKADGYGHGACTVARAAVAAEWLGTTDIVEASERWTAFPPSRRSLRARRARRKGRRTCDEMTFGLQSGRIGADPLSPIEARQHEDVEQLDARSGPEGFE